MSIGNEVMFIDTVKYFQQSLGSLASNLTENEKLVIWKECKKFIKKDENLARKFNLCSKEDQKWVSEYLSTGKGTIPYEMITGYDSFDISPDDENFFLPHHFYSSLKDKIMANEEYENVKKKLSDKETFLGLGELNKIYNFQDTIILCEIFEQRSEQLQKLFKFNLRKCNSVIRDQSKCLIALPVEHARVFEKTLIGGFSCINTRLAFWYADSKW